MKAFEHSNKEKNCVYGCARSRNPNPRSAIPGHREAANAEHRAEVADYWGVDHLPSNVGLSAVELFEGVRSGQWRILVGQDAEIIDQLVREDPESAYEPEFMRRVIDHGHLGGLNRS